MVSLNLPDRDIVHKSLMNDGYVICDNCYDLSLFYEIQAHWINFFCKKNLNFKSKNIHGYSQMIGQENLNSFRKDSNLYLYRHRDYFWNSPLSEKTRNLSKELSSYVNHLNDLPKSHGLEFNENKQVIFNQINCYPNEGFMYKHKDIKEDNLIINSFFPITFKNEHYNSGGLFIENNSNVIDIDSKLKPTSIALYNGNLLHEVKKIKSNGTVGRIAGYPMKQFFLNKADTPNYIKFLIQADISIKKLFGSNVPKQGNSSHTK